MLFKNRKEAGRKLAEKLEKYKNNPKAVVLGLPRGGVVLAVEVARELSLPLDIIVPRKIGAPVNPEFAIGAIGEGGVGFFDEEIIRALDVSREYIERETKKEQQESLRRLRLYRGDKPPLDLKNKITILVDDGLATGATMIAAIKSAKAKGAGKVVAAVPVAAADSLEKVKEEVDEAICIEAPELFGAVGAFYSEFEQVEDEEVIKILQQARPTERHQSFGQAGK